MTKTILSSSITLLFTLIACSLPASNSEIAAGSGAKTITLSLARRIIPGKTSAKEMQQLLGEPDSIRRLEEYNQEVWTYLRKSTPPTRRMYAFVSRESNLVKSVTWNVFEREPESDLESAKDAVGKLSFRKSEPAWTKGDAAPDEIYFISDKERITIVLRKTLNHVSTIMWN